MTPLSTDELTEASRTLHGVRESVSRVFLGDPTVVDHLLIAMMAKGHVLLEGVPGVAKTTLVRAFAAALGCSVRRLQFTPDLLPADITGSYVLNPQRGEFAFRPGPVFANVVLADEINRAPAKTQSALLEAMQEERVTVEGESFALPTPFLVLATQNPLDMAGTYPLPEAQIDRFLIRARIGYPSRENEVEMLRSHGVVTPNAQRVVDASTVENLQRTAARIHVEDDLLDYAVGLVTYTRRHPKVLVGASPRAALGLLRAAKARAVLEGRAFLTPDDLQAVASSVLAHRIVLEDEHEDDSDAALALVKRAVSEVTYRRLVRPV